MKRSPYFSVCIPNYNYGHYLEETIESVLQQSFEDLEVVIVDNASTDNSVEVIKSFSDPRIRFFQNKYNIGFAPNLQRASQYARGDYILMVSSDDLMYPSALADYAAILKRQGDRAKRTVLCASTDTVDSKGKVLSVNHLPAGQTFPVNTPIECTEESLFEGENRMSGAVALTDALRSCQSLASFVATAYPRAMWEAVEGYDVAYQMMPDAAFLHKLLGLDPDFIFLRKRLFAYRVHDRNQTAQATTQRALRYQSDGYMRTLSYPQATLDGLGVSRTELVDAFVEVMCLDQSFSALARNEWQNALRQFLFALACYPKRAIRFLKFYILIGLFPTGPVACKICSLAKKYRDG